MADPQEPVPAPPARAGGGANPRAQVGMAAERTWLAWWRTALAATAGALAIGRIAPQALHAGKAPFVILGCGYGLLGLAVLIVGAVRQRQLQRVAELGGDAPLSFRVVVLFTVGGTVLAVMTVVMVLTEA